jgi:hypothetical protein
MNQIFIDAHGRLSTLAHCGHDLLVASFHVSGGIDTRYVGAVLFITLDKSIGCKFHSKFLGQPHGRQVADGDKDPFYRYGPAFLGDIIVEENLSDFFLSLDLFYFGIPEDRNVGGKQILAQMFLSA